MNVTDMGSFSKHAFAEPNIFYGRTPQFRLVRVESDHDIVGATLGIKIEKANKTALVGSLL